jgi:large repetitive protein
MLRSENYLVNGQSLGGFPRLKSVVFMTTMVFMLLAFSGHSQNTDLPGPTANLQTAPVGTWVIPMDSLNYANSNFNMKCYGLVVHLLNNGVDLQWVIKTGKQHNGIDFTTSAKKILPTAATTANRNFRSGPILILPQDTANVRLLINNFNAPLSAINRVNIYQMQQAAVVDIRYTLNKIVKAGILTDGGNEDIHLSYFTEASIPVSNYSTFSGTELTANCYTFASEPHSDVIGPAIDSIRAYTLRGGNFFAQCKAVLVYENQPSGRFHTTLGHSGENPSSNVIDENADLSFSQFLGNFNSSGISGSVKGFNKITGSYANSSYSVVRNSTSIDERQASVSKMISGKGGLVFYAGGHDFFGNGESRMNGMRLYFNAMITPSGVGVNGNCWTDTDGDGAVDIDDIDDDNDGILDTYELTGTTTFLLVGGDPSGDFDADGIPNFKDANFGALNSKGVVASLDFDVDGHINSMDLDMDGDGITDVLEAGGADADFNGIIGTGVFVDTDKDGLSNVVDTNNGGTPLAMSDTDTDGKRNFRDIDSDNDGIVDNIEAQTTSGYLAPLNLDANLNGLDNRYEFVGGTYLTPINTDSDSFRDYVDTNSDNDASLDRIEGWDTNGDEVAEIVPANIDSDNDGLDNAFDNNDAAVNPTNGQTPLSFPNAEGGTAERDWRELENTPPTAVDDMNTTAEDTSVNGSVASNDTDPEGSPLTFSVVGAPSNGTISMIGNGNYTYTPGLNFTGVALINYEVCDNGLPSYCDTGLLSITVTPVNDAPDAINDATATNEDTSVSGNVLSNDLDVDSATLIATLASTPSSGTIMINSDGTYTYTPATNFVGTVSITYQVCDSGNLCDQAQLTITVNNLNDAPVANDDFLTTPEDVVLTGNVSGNDTDDDAAALTYSLVTPPASGTFVLNSNGTFTYTPAANYNGTITLVYSACDNQSLCDNATVTITVSPINDAPVAVDDSYSTDEEINLSGTVAPNDFDIDSSTLTYSFISTTAGGTTTINSDGTFDFIPVLNFNGVVTITYQVCDAQNVCDVGLLIITVNAVNDAPVANSDNASTLEDTEVTGTVATNDSDLDSSILTWSILDDADNGNFVMNSFGDFSYLPGSSFFGYDTITYQVCDNGGLCAQTTLTISVGAVNDAPFGINDVFNVNEDQVLSESVATNDNDIENDGLTYSLITPPTIGTVLLNANGTFTYTPPTDFSGTISFNYQVCDNGTPSLCDNALVTINVIAVNDAPIANNDVTTTDEDTQASGTVAANDTDADADVLQYSIIQFPSQGAIGMSANGNYDYLPPVNFVGMVTVHYQVCDLGGLCDTALLMINVQSVNDAPIPTNDNFNVDEDNTLNESVATNDVELEGEPMTFHVVSGPQSGTLVMLADGSFTYTPVPNFAGTVTVVYEVCDNHPICVVATLTINVLPINDAPTANDDNITVNEDTSVNGNIDQNDFDIETGALVYTVIDGPTVGVITLDNNGTYSYQGNQNYFGSDSVLYQVCDTQGACDTAMLFISISAVNDAPDAQNDEYTFDEDMVYSNTVAINDIDVDGGLGTYTVLQMDPLEGTINMDINGNFDFIPNLNFNGQIIVLYQLCDNEGFCDTAELILNINPVNDMPIVEGEVYYTNEDTALQGDVSDNDSDVESVLSYTLLGVTSGVLTLNNDGTFNFIPASDESGTVTAQYVACDSDGACLNGNITIEVIAVNDPPTAVNDMFFTPEDTNLTDSVSLNDSDIEGQSLTYSLLSQPGYGSLVMTTQGVFTYTAFPNYFGQEVAVYQVCDADGACSTALLTIEVTPVNDLPIVQGEVLTTNEDVILNSTVANNDSDIESPTLTYSVVTAPAVGVFVLNANGTFSYTPPANFTGLVSAEYMACDAQAACSNGILQIDVLPVNDAPVATNDVFDILEDNELSAAVVSNDADLENDVLTYVLVSPPTTGSIIFSANGTFVYTPVANYFGAVTFTYQACDATLCDNALVTINVQAVNDAPVAIDDVENTNENIMLSGSVATNDTDIDSAILTWTIVSGPYNGTTTFSNNGTFSYTPDLNYNGYDTLNYSVCDGIGLCDQATLLIAIGSVNQAPDAVADNFVVDEDSTYMGNVSLNDSDIENDSLFYSVINNPLHGSLILNVDGTFEYTPNADYFGNDEFVYSVCDNGIPSVCNSAVVSIAVTAVNDAPSAADDVFNGTEDSALTGNLNANDFDIDSGVLTYTNLDTTTCGTFVLNNDGTFVLSPTANWFGVCNATYIVCDNSGACDTATVVLNIAGVNDAPVAVTDYFVTSEDSLLTGNLNLNDINIDNDTLTYTVSVDPLHGDITLNEDGTFEYTPDWNYFGGDTIVVTICDTLSLCDTDTLFIAINSINDAPYTQNDSFETEEDVQLVEGVVDNDFDAEDEALEVTVIIPPLNGEILMLETGAFTYIPDSNYFGIDSLSYAACDDEGVCDTAWVFINVISINDAPSAIADTVVINEDEISVIDFILNNIYSDDISLTYTVVDSADYGMAVLDTNNILTYTPNPDYFGQDTIVISICDELLLCDNDTIIITINPVNDLPIAQNDSLIVLEDNLLTQSVIGNDIDVDDNVLTTSLISGSLSGLSTISTSGILSYMPNPDFFGVDSLTYSLCDDEGLCDTAWVFINVMAVNDIPVGIDDSYYTDYFIPLSDSVWANDYDVDGDTLLYTVLVNPMNGTIAMSTEGDFIYTPDALFTGNDTLYYTVCDADLICDTVMVVITVGPIPDLIVLDDMFDLFEDETLTNTVVTNDTPDLTYTLLSTTLVGDVNFEIDGSFVYSPDTNYFGTGELVYIACNQYSFCDTATVYINVIPVNDAPIAAGDTTIVCGYSAISIDAFAYVTDVDGSDFIINSASSDQGLVTFDAQTGIIQFVPNVDIDSAYVNCEICDMGTPQLCATAQWLFVFTHTQFTISASQQNLICEQDEASIMVTATGGSGNINYVWSNQATSATIDNLIAGDYSVTIEDALGCANDTTLNFIIPALVPFSVESTFKDATCNSAQNGEIELSISGGTAPYYVLWNDGSEDSLRTGLVPELYSYIVQDANLCTREGVIEISVASNDCFLAVNGFSPDGDGLNETFVVLGLENYLDNHLVIVNRWGNTVFETEGYDNTWDGSLKTNGAHFGNKVPPGTYFYQLYITLLERTLSGFVTIKYAE